MVIVGLMMAGAGTIDAITANLLPITAKHFTSNVGLIGVMVALNRVCGFLVQPYAAWKSDRHRSAGGRRRPFLLVAWPAVLCSVVLLGALPYLVPPEYHHTLVVIGALFLLNLIMQAFLDVCYGSGDPLYGDCFVAGEIGRANGVRFVMSSLVALLMTGLFVPLADKSEIYPYLGAMLFAGLSWAMAAFFLKERLPDSQPPPQRYAPWKPLEELRNPHVRKICVVASAVLVVLALTEMLHALFVTETLGLSKTVLGLTTTVGLVLSLVCGYPLGTVVDRVGARQVLMVGFAILIVVELGFVFWVHDLVSLSICLALFKLGWLAVHLPVVPLMFHDTPAGRRGSIFAAVQMTRAGVTSAVTIAVGFLADVTNSYRVCYLVAAAVCVVGLVGAMCIARNPVPAASPERAAL